MPFDTELRQYHNKSLMISGNSIHNLTWQNGDKKKRNFPCANSTEQAPRRAKQTQKRILLSFSFNKLESAQESTEWGERLA